MEKTKKSLGIVAIVMTFVLLAGVVGYVVYAAITQSFNFGGKVSFEADGVNATVEATGWENCTIGGAEYSDEQTILPKIVYSTDKGLVDTSGVSAWEDLDVVITDSPATLTFKVTNDSSDTALDVEIGEISYTNTSTNEIKIESDVESETVEAGESLSITITFTVSDTAYGAEISDFNIPVTLTKSEAVVATVGDFSYTLNESNSTATVTAYTGTETYVTIPSTIDVDDSSVSGEAIVSANATTTYSVTKIASGAFSDATTIITLILPDTIEMIGANAFAGCTALETLVNKSSVSLSAGTYGIPETAEVTTSDGEQEDGETIVDLSWMTGEYEVAWLSNYAYYNAVVYIENLEETLQCSLEELLVSFEELASIDGFDYEITEEEDGTTTLTLFVTNDSGTTDDVTNPVFGITIADSASFYFEGSDYCEAIEEVMADIIDGVNNNLDGYRDTYFYLSEVFAKVQEVIDILNEGIENEEDQYSLIVAFLDEDGSIDRVVSDSSELGELCDYMQAIPQYVSFSIFSADELEETEECLYSFTNSYFLNTITETVWAEWIEGEKCCTSFSVIMDVGNLCDDFDFENYNLSFMLFDPSTEIFFILPVTEDMFDSESNTLTLSLPCTGSGAFFYYSV